MGTQKCKACSLVKPLDEFFNNSVKKNGKDSKCKECRSKKADEYRQDHLDDLRHKSRLRYAANRESYLASKAVYYEKNRASILSAKAKYRVDNLAAINQRISNWRQKNAGELKRKAKAIRDAVSVAVLELLGPRCQMCGEVIREFLTIDHVNDDGRLERHLGSIGWKRKILSGEADVSRYQVLCHNCNNGKYRRNPVHHLLAKELVGKTKVCIICRSSKDLSEFRSQKSHSSSMCLNCARRRTMAARFECVRKMGGVCRCCGEPDPYKLTVDHVHNNGSVRRHEGERSGIDMYRKIVSGELDADDFQLLCWNCNYSKWINDGLCYHEKIKLNEIKKCAETPIVGKPGSRPVRERHGEIDQVDFDFSQVMVAHEMIGDDVRTFLDEHHYAGFGRASSDLYVARLNGEILGVAKFAPPVRQGVASSLGLSNEQVVELDRFCLHPARHKKNVASNFMGKVIKLAREDHPNIKKMVSFADPRFGHVGIIYKATNWKKVGLTSRSYYYEDANGREINKKTLYEFAKTRNLTERKCAEALGYKKVHTPPKIKFVYDLR
jgi:hypothetical protein